MLIDNSLKHLGTVYEKGISLFYIGGICLLLLSCSSTEPTVTSKSYSDIQKLEEIVEADPTNFEAIRNLGILYAKSRNFENAQGLLQRALALSPNDPETRFYFALTHEFLNHRAEALQIYQNYADIPESSPYRALMQGRTLWLSREMLRDQLHDAIMGAEQQPTDSLPSNTVAIFPLVFLGEEQEFESIGRGVGQMLAEDLSYNKSLWVVEPLRVQTLLRDPSFGAIETIDPETAMRLGRVLKAGRVVGGSFMVHSNRLLQVDIVVWDLAEKRFPDALSYLNSVENLSEVRGDILKDIQRMLEIPDSSQIPESSLPRFTTSIQAFQFYSTGLEYDDEGKFEEAVSYYQQALQTDTAFTEAAERLAIARTLVTYGIDKERVLATLQHGAQATPVRQPRLVTSRLQRMERNIGSSFGDTPDARKGAEEVLGGTLPEPPSPPPPR